MKDTIGNIKIMKKNNIIQLSGHCKNRVIIIKLSKIKTHTQFIILFFSDIFLFVIYPNSLVEVY